MKSEYRYTKPVEMPRSTYYGNNYYVIPSRKLNRNVIAFSFLEYANILTLEMNPLVEFYCEQPCTVDVYVDGMKFNTTFDMYVVYTDGREEMQEIKYLSEYNGKDEKGERDRAQVEKQKHWCRQNAIDHALRTDDIIMPGNFTIRNLEWLAVKARRYTKTDEVARKILLQYLDDHKKDHGAFTIGQLYTTGNLTTKDGLNLLSDMFYRGDIYFKNLDNEQITNRTEVYTYGK